MQEKSSPKVAGKDEMNLADFAISVISDRAIEDQPSSLVRRQTVKTPQGLLEQEWQVTCAKQWGYPQPSDDDVLLGLIHLACEEKLKSQTVSFSRYGLCKLMGWSNKGQNYARVEGALQRLAGVKINAKHSFYDGRRKAYVSKVFGVIDSFSICEKRAGDPNSKSYAKFSDELWESIQANNLKPLDLQTYYQLRSPIAKRLYRFLDKRRLNRASFELELEALCSVNIGLSGSTRTYPSQLKQSLAAPHRELVKLGFLSEVRFFKGSNSAWRVRYSFSPQKTGSKELENVPPVRLPETRATSKSQATPREEELWLIQRGVSQAVAQQLVATQADRIPEILDFYDFVRVKSPGYWKNPIGWLVSAVREGYHIPVDFEDYVPRAQREALAKEKQMMARQQEEKRERAVQVQEARLVRLSELSETERGSLVDFVRSMPAYRKVAEDHPAFRGALLEALDSDAWRQRQFLPAV